MFDDSSEKGGAQLLLLPSVVLEHILTFLPDASVGAACQVCRSWHDELMGSSSNNNNNNSNNNGSPHLWRHLLQRRHWPIPVVGSNYYYYKNNNDPTKVTAMELRRAFIRHYRITRETTAIQSALNAMENNSDLHTAAAEEEEGSPSEMVDQMRNGVEFLHAWGRPDQILIACRRDCSIRLLQSSSVKTADGKRVPCRQVFSRSFDLSPKTKEWAIMSAALNEHYIACICKEYAPSLTHQYKVLLTSRSAFSMEDCHDNTLTDDDDSTPRVLDVKEAFLNYYYCYMMGTVKPNNDDDDDDDDDPVIRFVLDSHRAGDEIEVQVQRGITACGNAQFMLKLGVYVRRVRMLVERLALFSATSEAFVWIGGNSVFTLQDGAFQRLVSSSFSMTTSSKSQAVSCSIAISPDRTAEPITVLKVESSLSSSSSSSSGLVSPEEILHFPQDVAMLLQEQGCLQNFSGKRFLGICSSHVVVLDALDDSMATKYLFTCIPRYDHGLRRPGRYSILDLDVASVMQMKIVRDEHVIISYQRLDTPRRGLWIVLMDISSGQEIGRQRWTKGESREESTHSNFPAHSLQIMSDGFGGDTIGVSLSHCGVVMTGNAIFDLARSHT